MLYLYPNQVIFLHKQIVALTGGAQGLRDQGLLESAVYRPQMSFGGSDLYPDIYLKASALIHSVVRNHPFNDANKRTGFEALRLFLRLNGLDLKATENEKYDFVLRIARERSFTEDQISSWIRRHSVPRRGTQRRESDAVD